MKKEVIALPPGIELDRLVGKKMGHTDFGEGTSRYYTVMEPRILRGAMGVIPHYSKEENDAMPLAIKHQLSLIPLPDGRWFCGKVVYEAANFGLDSLAPNIDCYFEDGHAIGDTPAHAICLVFVNLPEINP